MNKYLYLFFLSCFTFGAGLYQPHILRTMKGEMGLAENTLMTEDSLQPLLSYDQDTARVPGLKWVKNMYTMNSCLTCLPPMLGIVAMIAMPQSDIMAPLLVGCFFPSIIWGPSYGLFYADQWGRGCVSGFIRAGLIVCTYLIGVNLYGLSENHDGDVIVPIRIGAYVVYAGGFAAGAYTIVNDTQRAHKAIIEHNKKIRLEYFHRLEQGQEKVGLGLSWRL